MSEFLEISLIWRIFFLRLSLVIILIVNILFGCSEQERILSGKREDPASSFGFLIKIKNSLAKDNRIELPPMKANNQWTVISSAISKDHPNLMLSENPSEIWSTSIGKGDSKKKGWLQTQFSISK